MAAILQMQQWRDGGQLSAVRAELLWITLAGAIGAGSLRDGA